MRLFLISLFCASTSPMAACPTLLDRNVQTLDERAQSLCQYAGVTMVGTVRDVRVTSVGIERSIMRVHRTDRSNGEDHR